MGNWKPGAAEPAVENSHGVGGPTFLSREELHQERRSELLGLTTSPLLALDPWTSELSLFHQVPNALQMCSSLSWGACWDPFEKGAVPFWGDLKRGS